jgi:serine/threonine protein kinase
MTANEPRNGVHACPDREELRALHAGRLPSLRLEAIAAHLNVCPSCSSVVDELHDSTPPPLSGMARARPLLSEEEARRAVAIAERAGGLAAPAVEQPAPGEMLGGELGQYQLLEALGAGGMGQVFKARHRLMERTVALKVIHPRYLRHPTAVRRFRQEIRTLARLDHPNIVRAYDAYQARDLHVLVMEYVHGKDLARLVRQRGPLPVAEACHYVRQAALGLQHAHEHGLVHRDLKPSNLIVARGEGSHPLDPPRVKVLDLGLALIREEERPVAGGPGPSGPILGTLDYMAPEQLQDPQAVDIRADLYSLGCTLYHLLAGHPPFRTPVLNDAIARRNAEAPLPPIRAERTEVPEALVAVLQRLLARDPAQRYATPAVLAEALEPFILTVGQSDTSPERKDVDATSPERKRRDIAATSPERKDIPSLALRACVRLAGVHYSGQQGRRRTNRRRLLAAAALVLVLVAGSLIFWHTSDRPVMPASAVPSRPDRDPPPAAAPLRVVSFRVSHHRGDPSQVLGDFGIGSCLAARDDDDARVHVELSEPAHCFLIAFDPNGEQELCHPRDPASLPARMAEIHYPPDRVAPARQSYFALNNGAGLQAFALLVSREPLPPFPQWQARVGVAPWRHEKADGVWSFDGRRLQLLGVERSERQRDGPPPAVEQLCRFLQRCPGIDAVQVLAFPVK